MDPKDLRPGRPADSCVMVIFGAGGDLTRRKLIPALYNLAKAKLLSENLSLIALARDAISAEAYREQLARQVESDATGERDPEIWKDLLRRIDYLPGDVNDPATHQRLRQALEEPERRRRSGGNALFYLAVGPNLFGTIADRLGAAGLATEEAGRWRRLVVEKPFGRDLASAQALNAGIRRVFAEPQVYRIDHYLGKETVQNLLVFRFGNGIFEPIWNRRYIDHVQITAAETVGVEHRGGYYETSGALRDMVPNHLFQLVTLTAMEPPVSFAADAVHDEQAKILKAVAPLTEEEVLRRAIRGQYGEGSVDGEPRISYRAEPRVAPDSAVETFVALKLDIDNWRWADVPFYLRTGKRLSRRVTEIAIQFRRVPFILFRNTPVERLRSNRLVIRIAPDEGISLRFGAKVPGPIMNVGAVEMDFSYTDYFGATPSSGYERLLYDCMIGDATLFQRADMVETGWGLIQPILDVWGSLPPRAFPNYTSGSWGPREADDLLSRDGREWRRIGE
jgi:glucose-6-phosphate 1-dehydrogenase